jgi:hypothetical protein
MALVKKLRKLVAISNFLPRIRLLKSPITLKKGLITLKRLK